MRALLVTLMLSAVALAGCLGDDSTGSDSGNPNSVAEEPSTVPPPQPTPEPEPEVKDTRLFAGPPLWHDPQNTPHPDFNWPTISHPAPGATGLHAPIAATPTPMDITGLERIGGISGDTEGAGLAAYGSIAVVPAPLSGNTRLVDISNPADPQVVGIIHPQQSFHTGAGIIAYPDGRIVTVISGGDGIDVWDITQPSDPIPLTYIVPTSGNGGHKVGVVPGTPIVYNAASNGGGLGGLPGPGLLPGGGTEVTEIYDLTDPANPVHVMDWENGYSCHHIFFWNDLEQEKYRGLCAGVEYTQIFDTADPRDPQLIVSVPVHHGVAQTPSSSIYFTAFSHFAGLNSDGTVLIVGDETGGGTFPQSCVASKEVDPADTTASTPVGALWFYDVTVETSPQLLGWYSTDNDPLLKDVDESCTAHHGRLVPSDDKDLIAMSFYSMGTIIVDFTDPQLPHAAAHYVDNSDTWETWYYNGYLFTGDVDRGMDVLRIA